VSSLTLLPVLFLRVYILLHSLYQRLDMGCNGCPAAAVAAKAWHC